MEAERSGETLVEASPLISFLKIERVDILEALYLDLLCTDHVRREVTLFRQHEHLEELLAARRFREVSLSDPNHLVEYARLTEDSPLGPGEASSIVYAYHYGCRLLITDRKAIREAKRRGIPCVTTEEVMVKAIRAKAITLKEADTLIRAWVAVDEFPVSVVSFASLV